MDWFLLYLVAEMCLCRAIIEVRFFIPLLA